MSPSTFWHAPSFGTLRAGFQTALATLALLTGTLVAAHSAGITPAVDRESAPRSASSGFGTLAYVSPDHLLSPPAYCGLSVAPASPARLPDETGQGRGVLITGVAPNSPAAKAGLRIHDVLIQYDRQDVRSADELMRLVQSDRPGHDVVVSFLRAGKELETKMTLGQAAALDVARNMPSTTVGNPAAKSAAPTAKNDTSERWFSFRLPQAWRTWWESSLPSIQSASLDRQTK